MRSALEDNDEREKEFERTGEYADAAAIDV
jgi:hypothetical protein